jgi:uncharacterized LabA/DUF88 family protein
LFVVTTDPRLADLFRTALMSQVSAEPSVSLSWAPTALMAVESGRIHMRPPSQVLPPRVDVRLDYENLYRSLISTGRSVTPHTLVAAIRSALADLGNLTRITAYAPWDVLSREAGTNLERELTLLGVRTRFVVNIRGKNSADMEIADDVRTLAERHPSAVDAAEIIVLGTGDRDFRRTLETARSLGKRVVLLSLHNGLSSELRLVAGEDLRYLDDLLIGVGARGVESTVLARRADVDAGSGELPGVRLGTDDGGPIAADDAANSQVMQHLLRWVPDRIAYSLQIKGMPWVDTGYLARGMQMDSSCRQLQVGQTAPDAERWLEWLAGLGVIVKQTQRHPRLPSRSITTWSLPQKRVLNS